MPRDITHPTTGLAANSINELMAIHSHELLVSQGYISGHEPFRKFGNNPAVAAGETLISNAGGTSPHWPTVAVTIEALSGSTDDTANGSGAKTIQVDGLDANFNRVSAIITMAGQSASTATSQKFLRVTRAYVLTTGTYRGTNVGLITIRVSSAGTTFVRIAAGRGQTQTTHYCVPAGYTLFIRSVRLQVDSTKSVSATFWQAPGANDITSAFTGAKRIVADYQGATGSLTDASLSYNMKFSAYTDLWFSATASGGGGGLSAEYSGQLIVD